VQTRAQCVALAGRGVAAAWDRPCEVDADCPFATVVADPASTSFLTRGACLPSGYCELPLGVRRIGHTHAAATASPALALHFALEAV
jgi:hypothetical protein